ncbi:toll/interleukin-1 receptor domain-containing protein [Actinokineospora sp. 24-640]
MIPTPTVFVSYTHQTPQHKQLVLEFARTLQQLGIDTTLDRWTTGIRKDWYPWMIETVTRSDYILAIASSAYRRIGDGALGRRHRGTQSEAALLRELVYSDRRRWLPKILPVVLPDHTVDQIPLFLQPRAMDNFVIKDLTQAGMEDLLRVLTQQPKHLPPALGTLPALPPLTS